MPLRIEKSFAEEREEIQSFTVEKCLQLFNYNLKIINSLIFDKKKTEIKGKVIKKETVGQQAIFHFYERLTHIFGEKKILKKYGPRQGLTSFTDFFIKPKAKEIPDLPKDKNEIFIEVGESENFHYPVGLILAEIETLKKYQKKLSALGNRKKMHLFSLDFFYLN